MEKHDIKIALSSFNNICRVCLAENGELESIYGVIVETDKNSEPNDVVQILKKYCDIEVSPNDEKPQHICKPCIRLFCESYAFFNKCAQSHQILGSVVAENKRIVSLATKNELEESNVDIINIEVKSTKNSVKVKSVRKRASQQETSYFSESEDDAFIEHDDDSDWEPSKDEVKHEVPVISEHEYIDLEQEKGDKDYTSSEELEFKPVNTTMRKRKQLQKKQPAKRRGRPRKSQVNKNDTADSEAVENQHRELICRFCNETFSDINTSVDHYDEVHAPNMALDVCIFCDRPKMYKKRENLLYHMCLHSKDSIKCIPCRKYFRNRESLVEHLNECFKVDRKAVIKLEESLEDNDAKPDTATSQPFNTQLSQKVLKLTQYDGVFTCQLCNEDLGEIDVVISHFEKVHLDDLMCIICLRTFSKQVPLFHLGLHSKKSHVCRPCRLFFRTKEEYDNHCVKYDHDKSLSCKICGKKFTRNYKKNKHMLSHLKEKNYSCNKCGKTFTYKTSLVRHFKMHFGKRFLCSSCGNAYTTKFMLQRHIRIMHTYVDEDGKPLPKPPPKPVHLQCEFCGEIFTTKYGYGRHIRRHPEFKEFKCKICSFLCDTRDQLDEHMENKHNKHTCDVCGKRFPFESELKTHHRKHEDMEMARFRCDVCGKTARTQTQLKVHYRIHTGERPFACEMCGKSFKQTAHLKVHMFQHTGKMPFKCEVCEKSFPFQHVMEIHMRTHTGEKPFQCMFCGNAYHDRTTMQKHQKKKHPEMPIQKISRGDYKISKL